MTKDEAIKILSDVIEVLVDKGDNRMIDMAYDLEQVLFAVTEGWAE